MTKSYFSLFLLFALISCGKSGGGGSSSDKAQNQSDMSDMSEISANSPVPNLALTWDANVSFINFTREQENKVLDAVDLIKQVLASEAFKKKILNFTYKGKKAFIDNNGLTNAQVYKKILEASEKLNPGKNNTMDITVETYYTDANVIGYTMPSINKIYMNRKYFNNFTPVQISSNMVHEWLHKLGFGHDYESTPTRPYSVPYAVGYIVKSLAAKY
jgi:hypothetical protein